MDLKVPVILILASMSHLAVLQERHNCTGGEVEFIVNPRDVTVPCTANMTANFTCGYRHSRIREDHTVLRWTINSRPYGPSEEIENHTRINDFNETSLHLRRIDIGQNNSFYLCEFHTIENGLLCAYRSTPGNLIIEPCKVADKRYVAYYRFEGKAVPSPLEEVMVFFSHQDIFVNSVITYSTVFSDSVSGDNIITYPFTSSFCDHELCNSSFKIEQRYLNSTGINVTVLANDSRDQVHFLGSDPIKIDVVNKFFNVSLNEEESKFELKFQSNQSETICTVASGPHKADCRNSTLVGSPVSIVTGTHVIQAIDIDLSFRGSATKFCFVVNATTGNKTVIMGGIYDTASTIGIYCVSLTSVAMMSTFAVIFLTDY